MKRFLLIAFASLCFLPVWALGNNSGETKANAIEFDWQNGNEQSAGTKWYRVDLAPLYDDLDAPTLMLHLTNLDETNTTTVTIKATLLGQTEERTYALAPKASQVWIKGAAMLVQTNTREVFLTLKTDHKIAISARAYETTDVDESCLGATLFSVEEDAAFWQEADTEKWYQVDLSGLHDFDIFSEAVVTIQNLGSATAIIEGGLSMDCPASGITDYALSIPAGKSITRTINRAMIDAVKGKDVYVRIRNNQPINVSVAYQDADWTSIFESTDANTIEVETDTWYQIEAGPTGQIYKIRMGALRGNKLMPEVRGKNDGTSNANVTVQVGFTPNPTSVIERKGVLAAGEQRTKDIEKNLIDGIALEDEEYLYVRVLSDQPISGSLRMKHVNEGNVCKTSVDFDWKNGHQQEANTTVWYAVDIKEAKDSVSDILLTVENMGGASATMHGDIAFSCPYLDLQSVTRTFTAGEKKNKRIQYSLFGMMATDTVWVGLTTNQKARITAKTEKAETVTPDDACLNAVVFNMEEGHKQRAGESIWYKVGIKELRYVEDLIYASIQNRSTAPLTINGELSLECPDRIANTTASLQIAAEGNYEKQISRDLIDNIDKAYDTVYVKLTGTQDFSFRVYLEKEDIGSTCSAAIPFNWTSGHDQQANTALWYRVDLTTAKARHSDVRLTVTNNSKAAGMVYASFAFECPSDEVPQTEKTYFQAGQKEKTKTIPYTALETAGDMVWVRVNSELGIHFEAELVTPEHFDTIECPEDVRNFAWDSLYQENGGRDTAWYYLDKSILDDITNSGETPRLYLHNTAGTANTITANVAYHCPITSTMISKSITLGNNTELRKMLERSFAAQVAGKDTVMVQLIASGPYEFRASLVNPDDGADCWHAQVVNLPDTLVQEAGTTMWYRLDVQAAADLRKKITFGIHNTDNTAGKVDAAVYFSCEEEAIAARTITLGANGTVSKEVTSELFSGLNSKYIYLQLTSAQQIELFATVSALDTLIPNITACEQAIPVAPNTLYTQEKDSAWYVVNIADLRDNTSGDGLLTVTNLSANTMTASAEISWECPVVYEMTKQTRTIKTEYTRTLPRTTIDATKDSLLYVLVTTDNPLSFRLDIEYSKGKECEDAILFDWVNGNIHASESPLWYRVELDENKVPEGKDLRLWIDNLDMTNPTDAGATLYFECNGQALDTIEHTFEAGESKYSDIDRQLLQGVGWADLIIFYHSDRNTKIHVELVEHMKRTDTTYVRICEGDPWTNPVTQKIMYFYRSWSDMAEESDPLQWNDTVHVRGGSLNCDSIYTFYVNPLALPADITESILIANNAIPVLKQGMEVFADSSIVNIERYFLSVDSVALPSAQWDGIPTGKLGKDISTLPLTLNLTDSCATQKEYEFTFPVEPYRVDSIAKDTTICEGSDLVLRDKQITIWNDTIVRDTIQGVTVPDTLGLERQIDSVYVYDIKVNPILHGNINKTICAGDVCQFGGNDIHVAGTYYDTIPSLVTGCDSIVMLTLEVLKPASKPVTTDTAICAGDAYYTWHTWRDTVIYEEGTHYDTAHYATGCDSVYYELRLTIQEPASEPVTTDTAICAGDAYKWHTWRETIITEAGTHYDTAHYTTGCDSVYYELRLTIQEPASEPVTTDTAICAGDAYTWHTWRDTMIYDAGTHYDTAHYATGCDSVYYVLQLTIQEPEDGIKSTNATIPAGTSYLWLTWKEEPTILSEAGTYRDTARYNATGCDSVYYELTLTIAQPVKKDTTIIDTVCAGTAYPSRTQSLVITTDTTWSEPILFHDAENGDIDSTYHYEIKVFRTAMPTVEESDIVAICGKAIDCHVADSIIKDAIKSEPLYAPNATVAWKMQDGDWKLLDASAIDGQTETVTLKYVIASDCDSIESDPIVVNVEQPTPANSEDMTNLPAVNKYNSYLLMIHLNDIQKAYDWVVSEEDVTWYRVAGDVDPLYPDDTEKDTEVGKGYYYTTGEQLAGAYYALIRHAATDASDCPQSAMTEVITCATAAAQAPSLHPTVANPAQDIYVVNLDPALQTEIRVYDTAGNLLNTYTTTDVKEFLLHAASQPGYYLVDIQTDGQKTTLRYIVK